MRDRLASLDPVGPADFLAKLATVRVAFEPARNAFITHGVRVSGLNPALARSFYPTFQYPALASASPRPGASAWRRRHPVAAAAPVARVTAQRGINIHAELAEWQASGAPPRDPLARAIATELSTHGIRLIASEVPILSRIPPVATAIDAIGVTPAGAVVVLEFKTGYSRRVRTAERLRHLPTIPSTPLNHAFLQLGMTRAILRETYDLDASAYLLIVANERGVLVQSLPPWARSLSLATLLQTPHARPLPPAASEWG
jgi:hypothetical protein